jgi:glycosyltransferase involved in cell wall biosynthesis
LNNHRQPRVSIVIPNYNYARYLPERFQSVCKQTFADWELIFLDDASSDNSVELVREQFSQVIQHTEINQINSGNPFKQWNRGARLARGEFLWIAEADDYCSPVFLERMVATLDAHPKAGLAYCLTTPIDESGAILDQDFHHSYLAELCPSRWHADFSAAGQEEVRHYFCRKNTITNVSGVLFRRQAYLDAGLAPETMRMCGDWLTYCRILEQHDLAFVVEGMNFHRQHPSRHTRNSVLDLTYFQEFLEVQREIATRFKLSAADRQRAFKRFMQEWSRLTVSSYGRISLFGTLAAARLAARYYPEHRQAIMVHLLKNVLTSMAGIWRP